MPAPARRRGPAAPRARRACGGGRLHDHDQRRTLLWFNPAAAGLQPLCDRDDGCRAEHGPRGIRFARPGQLFALDRVNAALLHVEQREGGATWFEARCQRAATPKPEGDAAF